jgi:hypothetical protein
MLAEVDIHFHKNINQLKRKAKGLRIALGYFLISFRKSCLGAFLSYPIQNHLALLEH